MDVTSSGVSDSAPSRSGNTHKIMSVDDIWLMLVQKTSYDPFCVGIDCIELVPDGFRDDIVPGSIGAMGEIPRREAISRDTLVGLGANSSGVPSLVRGGRQDGNINITGLERRCDPLNVVFCTTILIGRENPIN
jgi:hypothetical protein